MKTTIPKITNEQKESYEKRFKDINWHLDYHTKEIERLEQEKAIIRIILTAQED